jgi:NADPH2:quinone reductase
VRAAQVVRLDGPSGVEIACVGEPEPGPGEFVIDVHACSLSHPDLLLSRGAYQLKPELPFTLGIDFAGVVRAGPAGHDLAAGDRVAGWGPVGGAADVVAADLEHLFALPASVSYLRGACGAPACR